jgi:hypothetical protein
MIFFGQNSLQHAISQFIQRQRLGGMLNYYFRAAA